MSDHRDGNINEVAELVSIEDDAEVERLMNLAGARPAIPASLQSRVYEQVQREWLSATAYRRTSRWAVALALAASIVLAVTLLINFSGPPPAPFGTVARVIGDSAAAVPGWTPGRTVNVGDSLQTGSDQRISIALDRGGSLRVAGDTKLRFESDELVALDRGMIYADSGIASRDQRGLVIHTELGSVTDVGTQFLVQVIPDHFEVAVREGRVDIAGENTSYSIEAGKRLTIRDDHDTEYGHVSSTDDAWAWATEVAPGFEMENKFLFDFLEWAARETGKELVFASDDTLNQVKNTTLVGDLRGFTPFEAIDLVVTTTSFRYSIGEQRIFVGD